MVSRRTLGNKLDSLTYKQGVRRTVNDMAERAKEKGKTSPYRVNYRLHGATVAWVANKLLHKVTNTNAKITTADYDKKIILEIPDQRLSPELESSEELAMNVELDIGLVGETRSYKNDYVSLVESQAVKIVEGVTNRVLPQI